jgi:broad specificity phosphatase PhoE
MSRSNNDGCTFFIVRHGQTEWNALGKLQGHTDIPLNESGRLEAQKLQEEFTDLKFQAAYSSDLLRAKETAQIICKKQNTEVTPCSWLRERYYGPLEGTTVEERMRLYELKHTEPAPQSLVEFLASQFRPHIESAKEAYDRVITNLYKLSKVHPQKQVLVVTHAGILRYVLHPHLPSNDDIWNIQNCGWVQLHVANDNCSIVELKGIMKQERKADSLCSLP